ncbi:hypothetical protein XspCFBP7912_01370 [Xanthomonas sp. CFBP 7912]|nr:hypothetical protein XspCFBP7912_01370 [Xanthomonas sp. CFBP 7912]RJS02714.1 hypothetical protein XnspCFBP7698_14045 [Xanthomonas sp. CFBP 7698]
MTAAVHKIPGRSRTWPAWQCTATTSASDACTAAPCPMAPRPLGANACANDARTAMTSVSTDCHASVMGVAICGVLRW